MRKTFGAAVSVCLAAFATGAALFFSAQSHDTEIFSFTATNNRDTFFYRCEVLDNPDATKENAQKAHEFFEPVFMESIRTQASGIAANLGIDKHSSETVPALEKVNISADAIRAEANSEIRNRFGCRFLVDPA